MSQSDSAEFTGLADLASRRLGGSVVFANDEFFAEKENLIKPGPAGFAAGGVGRKGKGYEGCAAASPSRPELTERRWPPLVGKPAASGDSVNRCPVADRRRWTHVRLSIYPDGGVARLRVHGEVVPDPAYLTGTIDLAAMEHGGRVTDCSDAFYSSPANLIMPGLARVMSDGWENARRRGPGHDYGVIHLAAAGRLRQVEVDTSYFVGNAPGWIELSAAGSAAADDFGSKPECGQLLPRTRVQPDTRHRFVLENRPEATQVRLDVLPDGGLARLRVYGEITADARAALAQRWRDTTP